MDGPSDASKRATLPANRVFLGAEGLRAGWGLLLFIILFITIGPATSFLVHKGRQTFAHTAASGTEVETHLKKAAFAETSATSLYANEGVSLLAVLLATLALSRLELRPFRTYGLGGSRRMSLFAQGLFWGLLCLSLLIAALHLTGHLFFDRQLLPTAQAIRFGAIWAIGFTLVAFLEETLLRGYLQFTLTRSLRAILPTVSSTPHIQAFAFWIAALILSFVFGLGHGSNPGESPIGLLSAGLAGLVFSLALYRTGSLWWALGFHTSWDWGQSFLYGVPDSGTVVQHHFLATHPAGPALLSGGLTGPEGSILIVPVLALVATIIVLSLPLMPSASSPSTASAPPLS